MHAARHRLMAYIALGAAGAVFTGAAVAHLTRTPLIAVLLAAQVTVIFAFTLLVRDGRHGRREVAVLRADVAALREHVGAELTHLDEHVEMVAARTERLAKLLEVQKAVQTPGSDREATGEILSFPAGVRRVP
jgi:hypothetical protein